MCATISDQLEGGTSDAFPLFPCNDHLAQQYLRAQYSAKSSEHSDISGHSTVQKGCIATMNNEKIRFLNALQGLGSECKARDP